MLSQSPWDDPFIGDENLSGAYWSKIVNCEILSKRPDDIGICGFPCKDTTRPSLTLAIFTDTISDLRCKIRCNTRYNFFRLNYVWVRVFKGNHRIPTYWVNTTSLQQPQLRLNPTVFIKSRRFTVVIVMCPSLI